MSEPAQEAKAVDFDRAAAFVFSLPAQPVNLVSIDPTGASPPRAQTLKRPTSAAKWMANEQAAGRNLYYQDCALSVINKRPKKNDVTTIFCAHVDAEVQPKNTPSGPEFDRKRAALLEKLRRYSPAPNVIVDSGNGYQAFWYLAAPLKATDDAIHRVESINIYLRGEFGGDACQDVAHVMRVPFTKNFPNAVKRKLGRVECVAGIIHDDRTDFLLHELDLLPTMKTDATVSAIMADALAGAKGEYAAIGAPGVPDKVDLHKLPDKIRRMIEKGTAGSRQIGDGSRSDLIYHVACEMRRREYSDGEILATITNPDFEISSHYSDQPQRDILDQASRVILHMNKDGVIADADKRWQWDDECQIVVKPPAFVDKATRELVSFKSFDLRYNYLVGSKENASTKATHSRHMERFAGLCYRPNKDRDTSPVEQRGRPLFNTWQPQAIEPLDEVPALFLRHCEYLIPDEQVREIFYDWLAHIIQRPEQKTMWAVVLFGPHGTGKSWLAELMRLILGASNCSQPPVNLITSDFNGWLAEKKLVVIHEAKRATRVGKLSDYLKDIITQPTVLLNRKGIEAIEIENLGDHFLITNEEDAIDIDPRERRYFVIECAALPFGAKPSPGGEPPYIRTKGMEGYYETLFEGMSDAELAANIPTKEARRVLSWLLKRKGGKVKLPSTAPATRARAEMIDANRTDLERWLREKYLAADWPFKSEVFNVGNIVRGLPTNIEQSIKGSRVESQVMRTCRQLGCVPYGEQGLRIGEHGRVRLWLTDANHLSEIEKWTNEELATAYGKSLKGNTTIPPAREPWDVE